MAKTYTVSLWNHSKHKSDPWVLTYCLFLLGPAIEYSEGRCSKDSIMSQLMAGHASLFVIKESDRFLRQEKIVAACVSEVRAYPDNPILHVMLVAGTSMFGWLAKLIDGLKGLAEFNSCRRIEMFGRPGWLKVLNRYGFKKKPTLHMELELN